MMTLTSDACLPWAPSHRIILSSMELSASSFSSSTDQELHTTTRQAALITGASGGIGRAICEAFGKAGWYVGVHYYRNKAAADTTLRQVIHAGGTGALYPADIREGESVRRMVGKFSGHASGSLVMICNAGIGQSTLLVRHSEEIWDNVITSNLTGTFHCLRAIAPSLIARRRRFHHCDRVAYGVPWRHRPERVCHLKGRTDRSRQDGGTRMGTAEYSSEPGTTGLAKDRLDRRHLPRWTRVARSCPAPSAEYSRSRRDHRAFGSTQGHIRTSMELRQQTSLSKKHIRTAQAIGFFS
jgi:NAD(P)-dependent dehydrogenase (short-subunit alcohol dehydrogenase family)